jgi:hypothetical protein
MGFRLKNGKVPAWMSTKPGSAGAAMPAMPANLVPIGSAGDDGLGSAADAESAQQQAEELRLHMETIRSRLKLERDFEGIDPFSIGDSEGDVERAMEMGVLPLQVCNSRTALSSVTKFFISLN